ncbi:CorA family divalent cation transporter [Bacillus marinisedimentorum]|uniref:CorA family divalent cation transporter n=1 Tax=Bacillus marinisedimentorum TaxID=1821260 RepID=UPI000872BE05|nr:CorA family divalent cation transporter [Bacillus marinisedimentorum]
MEYYFNNWEWHNFDNLEEAEKAADSMDDPHLPDWLDRAKNEEFSEFVSQVLSWGEEHATVSSLITYDYEEDRDMPCYIYVTKKKLITIGLDFSKLKTIEKKDTVKQFSNAGSAPQGLLRLLGDILESFLLELQPTGDHIKRVHERVSQNRRVNHLEQIYNFRYKLMRWADLELGLKELYATLEEAYLDELTEEKEYQLVKSRFSRFEMLIHNFEKDLDTLRELNNGLVSYRANEIMKTLTVFTVLITPITALGALWGMNFKYMPELDEKWGYWASLSLMAIISTIIFLWLKKKGWTGNILKNKDKKPKKFSFFDDK